LRVGVTEMAECSPTPARISEAAGSVTFYLRTDAGEVIELPPALQELFRGQLAQVWGAAFREIHPTWS